MSFVGRAEPATRVARRRLTTAQPGPSSSTCRQTVIRRCHVHHSVNARTNAAKAHASHHGRSSGLRGGAVFAPGPSVVLATFERCGSAAFTAIVLRAPALSMVYRP